jgi:hypothetical protein
MLSKRQKFELLLIQIKSGLYMANSIKLCNFGLNDNDLTRLFAAIKQNKKFAAKLFELNLSNDPGFPNPNRFNSVTVRDLPNLSLLRLNGTDIQELSLLNLPSLSMLSAQNNLMDKFTAKNTRSLSFVDLSDNLLFKFDASGLALETLWLQDNLIKILDLSMQPKLRDLILLNNPLVTLFLTDAPLWSRFHYDSSNFDVATLTIINEYKSNKDKFSDSYVPPEADEEKRDPNPALSAESLDAYFSLVTKSYKQQHTAEQLCSAANFYTKLKVDHCVGDSRLKFVPDDLLYEIALHEFKANTKHYLNSFATALFGNVCADKLSANQEQILKFQRKFLPLIAQKINDEAAVMLFTNKGLKQIVAARIETIQAQQTSTDLALVRAKTLVTHKAPLTWLLRRLGPKTAEAKVVRAKGTVVTKKKLGVVA